MDRFLIILAILIGGCAPLRTTTRPTTRAAHPWDVRVTVVLLSKSTACGTEGWRQEAFERFGPCVLVAGHGGMALSQWCIAPDEGDYAHSGPIWIPVDWVIKWVKAENPKTKIVLAVCNPAHVKLLDVDVFYASNSIWTVPDRDCTSAARFYRRLCYPLDIGDIKQFVEGTP